MSTETEGDFCENNGNETISQKKLNDAIKKQNKKACEKLNKAATSDIVLKPSVQTDPELSRTTEEVHKVWDTDSQSKINELHPSIREYVTRFLNMAESAA